MTTIAAIPFTVILSFEDSDYAGGTEMILRLVTPTYDEKNRLTSAEAFLAMLGFLVFSPTLSTRRYIVQCGRRPQHCPGRQCYMLQGFA